MSSYKSFAILILLTFLVPPVSATETANTPAQWRVKEAVRFALENSPDSRIVTQRIQSAQAAITAAQSAYFPRVVLSGGYSRTNNPMYSFGNILNQSQFSQNIDFNNPGTSDDLNLTGAIQYRLYNGGRDRAGINAARAQKKATLFEQDALYRRLAFEVVRSFYSIVQAEDNVEARTSSLQAIKVSLEAAQARFEAGDLLRADLLNLEVQKSRAAENLIVARNGLRLAKQGFLNLLGLKQGAVQLDTSQIDPQDVPQELNFANRPELARLDAMITAAREKVRQAQGGNYPSADLFGSYQVDKGFEFDEGSGNSWMAGVKVNYMLFDGQQTSAHISQATARLRELKEQRRKLELAFNYETQQAQLALQLADERLQVTRKMVEQAVESARLSRERFKEGVLLSTDLIEVENRLTDARVHNLMAKAAQKIAIADLRRVAGLQQFNETSK